MNWIIGILVCAVLLYIHTNHHDAALFAKEITKPEKFAEYKKRVEKHWVYKFLIARFNKKNTKEE